MSRANKKKPGMPNVANDLSQKLYATMEKHKEVCPDIIWKLAVFNKLDTFLVKYLNIFFPRVRFSLLSTCTLGR